MERTTAILIGSYFENFVENRISEGRFENASEVIRAGLRLLEEEENKILSLREALHKGIESGRANHFNPEVHLTALKAAQEHG